MLLISFIFLGEVYYLIIFSEVLWCLIFVYYSVIFWFYCFKLELIFLSSSNSWQILWDSLRIYCIYSYIWLAVVNLTDLFIFLFSRVSSSISFLIQLTIPFNEADYLSSFIDTLGFFPYFVWTFASSFSSCLFRVLSLVFYSDRALLKPKLLNISFTF